MDSVFIEHLEVIATIGVYDWEQEIKQKLVLDLEMAHDNRPAAQSDDVAYALDYAAVSDAVTQHIQKWPFLVGGACCRGNREPDHDSVFSTLDQGTRDQAGCGRQCPRCGGW